MQVVIEKKNDYCIACMKPNSSYDILVRFNNGHGSSILLCKECMKNLALSLLATIYEDKGE